MAFAMSSREPPADDDVDVVPENLTAESVRPIGAAGTTVGTGSALGVGCVAALAAFVLLALAARWLMGAW